MGIILKSLRKKTIEAFIKDIGQSKDYYVFVGKSTEWPNELVPDKESEAIKPSMFDTRRDMMIGKKIIPSDTSFMIKKIDWSNGNVYSYYDDTNANLYSSDFYCINSSNDVFKCLWNNYGSNSIVEPTSLSSEPFTLSDGYMWKYMYTVTAGLDQKFSTTNYVPVNPNSSITEQSSDGGIYVVKIDAGGVGYQQANGSVQEVINLNTLRVDSSHYNANGFFNYSSMYILSGNGAGQLFDINQYIANSSGRFVILNSNATNIDTSSQYLISPKVSFGGNGTGAKAYCTINNSELGNYVLVNEVLTASGQFNFDNLSIVNLYDGFQRTITENENINSVITGTVIGTAKVAGFQYDSGIKGSAGCIYRLYLFDINMATARSFAEVKSFSITSGNFVNARADAIQNNNQTQIVGTGFINSINIIDPGVGYDYCNVSIVANSNFGTGATASAIISPTGGHGYDPIVELGSDILCISVDIDGDENSTVNTEITFRQAGIISDLKYAANGMSYSRNTFDCTINTPLVDRFSGEVLYYDNVTSVTRSNTAAETVKLILKF